jgi:hypothetical protein
VTGDRPLTDIPARGGKLCDRATTLRLTVTLRSCDVLTLNS